MDMQKGLFGNDTPAWEATPPFGKVVADRVWWLWEEGRNQIIADDDAELMVQYWAKFEGLEEALGSEGFKRFKRWFTEHNPTPAENLRRTRQWVTSDETQGGPYIAQSVEVKRKRKAKEEVIRTKMAKEK